MSESTRRGNWIIAVDRFTDFGRDLVSVRIARKLGDGAIEMYGPGGHRQLIPRHERASEDLELVWYIPFDGIDALCAALQDRDPASERLTTKLEQLLDREAGRVDRLIEKVQG